MIRLLFINTKKETLLEIINNVSSSEKLICTKTHIVNISTRPVLTFKTYRKGEVHSRNVINLLPGYWKVCPQYKLPKSLI